MPSFMVDPKRQVSRGSKAQSPSQRCVQSLRFNCYALNIIDFGDSRRYRAWASNTTGRLGNRQVPDRYRAWFPDERELVLTDVPNTAHASIDRP